MKDSMKITGLTENYHMLKLEKKLNGFINFKAFAQTQFKLVEYIHISLEEFACQQLELIMKSIPKSFPNLKVFEIANCKSFYAAHWKTLIDNISNLANIQALTLFKISIQNIEIEDLNKLKSIKQLQFLLIRSANLTQQSQINLQSFKKINPQYFHKN